MSKSGLLQGMDASYQRPVLILLDRNEDLSSALHHPSTYQVPKIFLPFMIMII